MERSRTGYYQDPYLQYSNRAGGQVYAALAGTGNAPLPRSSPVATTMDFTRTGHGAGEGPGRVEYYIHENPAATGTKPSVGEYYIHGPTGPSGVRPVPAATYYAQEPPISGGTRPGGEYYIRVVPPPGGNKAPAATASYPPHAIPGGSKSCGCAPKVEYSYFQAPIAGDPTPIPLNVSSRQGLPPPATNQPPAGYYYVQESVPSRGATVPTTGKAYPPYGPPYPDESGQRIIAYERYVVPASSGFTFDPTSALHDYYRSPQLPEAPHPFGYRYDADGYPGHVTGSLQQIPNEVAQRLGAMRIGGSASDAVYLPRTPKVVYGDSEMWRPTGKILGAVSCNKCSRK